MMMIYIELATTPTRQKIWRTLIEPVFLYNSEQWTMSNKRCININIIQRKLLRRLHNIHWQDKLSNTQLYNNLNLVPWSNVIKTRRLKFVGHVARLPPSTPVRQSLTIVTRPGPKNSGGRSTTWLSNIIKELKPYNVHLTDPATWTPLRDREAWRNEVSSISQDSHH